MISVCVFISVLMIALTGVDGQKCNGGVQCVVLPQCTGLYRQLQNGNTPELTRLLRSLHCGFGDLDMPKICCPPEFSFNQPSNSEGTQNRGGSLDSRVSPTTLLPSSGECGADFKDKIVGGSQADIDEHPWMALLRYDKPSGWGFYCGGVLISHRYVLTAAHCVKGEGLPPSWRLSQVRLGEWNTSSSVDCLEGSCSDPPLNVPVEATIVHEGYVASDENQHHDIALLRLANHVQYTDYIKPICLPVSNQLRSNSFDGVSMEVAGWGKTETRYESDVKRKVSVPVVSKSKCGQVFGRAERPREIIDKQICAGGVEGKDSCRGDSGGSLMARIQETWYAMGVVSYGPSPCGTPGWPGVYTRVPAYIDWILSKLRP